MGGDARGRRQMEENKRERARLKQQYDFERRRRWRVLEDSGDLEQTLREVYGWEEAPTATGVLMLPTPMLMAARKTGARQVGALPLAAVYSCSVQPLLLQRQLVAAVAAAFVLYCSRFPCRHRPPPPPLLSLPVVARCHPLLPFI